MFVGGNLVSWKSKKQSVVPQSSAESEYRTMTQSVCEVMWPHQLLMEVDIETPVQQNFGMTTRLSFVLLLIRYSMNGLSILK